MSIKVQSYVWEHSRQRHGALLVLLAVADFADDNGKAYPSVVTLARKARLTERQAHRVLKQLEADGEISIGVNQGPHGCNLYTVKLSGVSKSQGDIKRKEGVTFATEKQEKMSPEPSVEPSTKPSAGSRAKPRSPSQPTDDDFINSLKANPAYRGIDVDYVRGKLAAWCAVNGKVPTRRKLVTWLNREDKPLGADRSPPDGSNVFQIQPKETPEEKQERLRRQFYRQPA